jgi:glycosyltransferase involved in cell wall biosynthesis
VARESLHIAWVGGGPGRAQSGGVPGVATELLLGLARRGHRIDCFSTSAAQKLPPQFANEQRLRFIWTDSGWRWNRWYSRTRVAVALSGLLARASASIRLRRRILDAHAADPFDVVYQFSALEGLGVPARLLRAVPLVLHPETHSAGELRALLVERRLGRRCQPRHAYAAAVATMAVRSAVQRIRVRRASLLVCISAVFRDHLVHDYRLARVRAIVVPNPVRLERFAGVQRRQPARPTVLVIGRVAARKGVEDVVAVANILHERGFPALVRVVGGPGLWSDYTCLLQDLPPENAEYVGRVHPSGIADELAGADVLLQASKYEPFGLTVAEALAAGVPVVATSEVGATEGVDPSVVARVSPGDAQGLAEAVVQMIGRLRSDPQTVSAKARAEAARLFATDVVCEAISDALLELDRQPGRGV